LAASTYLNVYLPCARVNKIKAIQQQQLHLGSRGRAEAEAHSLTHSVWRAHKRLVFVLQQKQKLFLYFRVHNDRPLSSLRPQGRGSKFEFASNEKNTHTTRALLAALSRPLSPQHRKFLLRALIST
jgi:hypothetical protein